MKTPTHLWIIGIVSLVWNAVGAFDYVMTVTRNPAYLANFTPEQLDYFTGFPAWAVGFWALGVWASVIGSVLLLLRSRHAFAAFVAALAGIAGTSLYTYVLAETSMADLVGAGAMVFTAMIIVVALALAWYARRMRRAQHLR
jgi:hypothetical protein